MTLNYDLIRTRVYNDGCLKFRTCCAVVACESALEQLKSSNLDPHAFKDVKLFLDWYCDAGDDLSNAINKLKAIAQARLPFDRKEVKALARSIIQQIAEQNQLSIISHRFKLSPTDKEAYQYRLKERMRLMPNADFGTFEQAFRCKEYALYAACDPKALDQAFDNDFSRYCLKRFLLRGYQQVDTPRKGDLIVYLSECFLPLHFGVMHDASLVDSKWGSDPQIFRHPIENTLWNYGPNYTFLRRYSTSGHLSQ
jgi:hypothetical protein